MTTAAQPDPAGDPPLPLREAFRDPPREFGICPFWAWNDDLDEEELLRQIRAMHEAGFGGFTPHVDLGLPRSVGYLTEHYFHLLRVCVEEAGRLGMVVILYDEGYYPSGSAQGRVVAENPAHAAQALFNIEQVVEGPARGYYRPNPGRALCDELVCAVAARDLADGERADGELDGSSLTVLQPDPVGLLRYDLPEGRWRIVSVWRGYSGGTIRGVFAEEDDGHAQAPAAGDIMNPDAVASFLRITHDAYARHLGDHLGRTVVAMFTDEPNPLGRSPRRGRQPWPYSAGLLDEVAALWGEDVRPWLPALWHDLGPRTDAFRRTYTRAVNERIAHVFYRAQAEWCQEHGIALTGHPSLSDEMEGLRYFQWPGQDMVWRYVEPARPESALEGYHSVAPRVAASAAALGGRRRNASELFGAYGWELTLDEAKWLYDWHLVRGTNLFVPGSCMYSLRGRRKYNSEPDIGWHNTWWAHYPAIARYVRRLCWLSSDGLEVCDVALLTDSSAAGWRAARELYRDQIGFLYVDAEALAAGSVEGGCLTVGPQRFRAVVCDPPAPALPAAARARLVEFRRAGGLVISEWTTADLVPSLTDALGRDLHWPGASDLRALHYRKAGLDCFLLVNEGERAIEGQLSLRGVGALEVWDALDGSTRPWPARTEGGRTHAHLRLERRGSLVLAHDLSRPPAGRQPEGGQLGPTAPGPAIHTLEGEWSVCDGGGQRLPLPAPGDWTRAAGWETYAGTLHYVGTCRVPHALAARAAFVDLGTVGDIAIVRLNGQALGTRLWAPYVLPLGDALRDGRNVLEVWVTNSIANRYNGAQRPSGLLELPRLRAARDGVATASESEDSDDA